MYDTFCFTQIDNHGRAFEPLNRTTDDSALSAIIIFIYNVTLGFAYFLNNYLFRSLRSDPAKLGRIDFTITVHSHDLSCMPINLNRDSFRGFKMLTGCRSQGRFDALKHNLLCNLFIPVQTIYQSQ